MRFFSGFSLRGEEVLFVDYLKDFWDNPYIVAGFSYGAIKAIEFAAQSFERIDRLILISHAWFQNRSEAFVKTQLRYYKKDSHAYLEAFLKNIAYPSSIDLHAYLQPSTLSDLKNLLTYQWPSTLFSACQEKGIAMETYLGGEDCIIDAYEAHTFFKQYTQSYLFKKVGHLLR